MDGVPAWWVTLIAVALLAAIATIGLRTMKVPGVWSVASALARAVLQLAALSLVLTGIIQSPLWVGIGLVVMLAAAVFTAARRAGAPWRRVGPLALAMTVGPLVVMTVVFGTGALALTPRYALAVGGIVIGNTMTVAILSQRIYGASLRGQWDEVEGWLALGATPWEATRTLARRATHTALLPSVDQTRTTGIVVLPGAFVGAVFAGASPLEAGQFQLVVLAGILAAGVLTSTILLRMTGGVAVKPVDVLDGRVG
ncbi:hypothetical protein ASD65_14815 [Microbacterium sp. Root61]|uniref:ABC transporter permease n=1 Tax=Microbacterium sp. Root61 TaxID=1736570 RepID=UPI0006F9364E|nr:ABC transporter permease [Microbacterium sp. Root61]KRA26122.1 hypothetical protein ASD65_14815 [Microbacterium sp. Root61]